MKKKILTSIFITGFLTLIIFNLSIIWGGNSDDTFFEIKNTEALASEDGDKKGNRKTIKEKKTIDCPNGGTRTACKDKEVVIFNGRECEPVDETECTSACETQGHDWNYTPTHRVCKRVGCNKNESIKDETPGNSSGCSHGNITTTHDPQYLVCYECNTRILNPNYCKNAPDKTHQYQWNVLNGKYLCRYCGKAR